MPDITQLVIAAVAVGATIVALIVMRSGGKANYKAEIEGLLSSALLQQHAGNWADAQQNYERAMQLLQYPGSRDDAKLATCFIHLSEIYEKSGNYAGAKDMRDKLVDLWLKQLKTGDDCALVDIDFAMTHNTFGAGTAQILEFYDKVVSLKENRFGPKSTQVADSYLITAKLLRALGEKDSAELAEQKAAEIRPAN
jgi:tetratricopeptide (TPR) repeat protein